VGAVVASILLVATAAIASTYTAQRVASNARALHWANSSLGTAAIARASVGQAVFFAVDRDLGVASDEAVGTAVASARRDLDIVESLTTGSSDGGYTAPDGLIDGVSDFVAIGRQALAIVDSGDSGAAADFKAVTLDPAFDRLAGLLSEQQQRVAGSIAATETLAGRIDTVTRVGIMLVLPAFAFAIYRRRAKRSIEVARQRHAAEIEIERRSATARDEFFAAISHELRTPLTTILGFSEVLMEGGIPDTERGEVVGLIRKDAVDLERRIDDLVAAARSAAGGLAPDPTDFDPGELVAETVKAAHADVYVDCHEAIVRADQGAFRHVVRNLLSNAELHGGSTVWVSGRVVGDRYLVSVSDDGEGFEADALDATHGPFAHDHREAILAGTIGLGLTAAVALAEANGGGLAYRRVSGWTQVGLFVPLAVSTAESTLEEPATAAAAALA
jgi:signal transduction histidine kinase